MYIHCSIKRSNKEFELQTTSAQKFNLLYFNFPQHLETNFRINLEVVIVCCGVSESV